MNDSVDRILDEKGISRQIEQPLGTGRSYQVSREG